MNKETVRAFSLGIFIVACVLWGYRFFFPDINKENAEEKGKIVLSSEEWEKLQSTEKELAVLKEKNQTLEEEIASLKDQLKESGDDTKEPLIIEIKSKMTLEEIASLLENVHIIDDREAFAKYMIDHGLDRSIQVGQYELYPNTPYETIGKLISKP